MSLAADFLSLSLELLDDFGTTATYVQVTGTGAAAGTVSEATTNTSVRLYGPLDEQKAEEAVGARAQWVLPASGLSLTPRIGDRIVTTRTWLVTGVATPSVAGTTIVWVLQTAEQPSADESVPPAEVAE